jgi:hypothetical protein
MAKNRIRKKPAIIKILAGGTRIKYKNKINHKITAIIMVV